MNRARIYRLGPYGRPSSPQYLWAMKIGAGPPIYFLTWQKAMDGAAVILTRRLIRLADARDPFAMI